MNELFMNIYFIHQGYILRDGVNDFNSIWPGRKIFLK